MPERLIRKNIEKLIEKQIPVWVYRSVSSTNTLAKRLVLKDKALPFLVAANGQTKGKGRQGKSFFSKQNCGIYMTLAVESPLLNPTLITAATAVAVARAINENTSSPCKIKWVNDIFINSKKVCGILCEAVRAPESNEITGYIIGIGINTDIKSFPDFIKDTAASVELKKGLKNVLVADIVNRLLRPLDNNDNNFLEEYRRLSCVLGKEIVFFEKGVPCSAVAVGIDDCGGLFVELESGEKRTLSGGEISLRVK